MYISKSIEESNTLYVLVSIQFQFYFTPLLGVLFTFPSRYLFTIGHQLVLRLGGLVPPYSDRISRVPPYSIHIGFSTSTGLSPFIAELSRSFPFFTNASQLSLRPCPLSLATTYGVSFDFLSSRYLDVSVP